VNMLTAPSPDFILQLASAKHNVSIDDIVGLGRARKIYEARREAIVLMFKHTGMSMKRIGEVVNRDHSTVLYSVKKTEKVSRFRKLIIDRKYLTGKGRPRDGKAALIVAGYMAGKPTRQIAAELGLSKNCVCSRASKMGLVHPNPGTGGGSKPAIDSVPDELRADFTNIRAKGFTVPETLNILGIDKKGNKIGTAVKVEE
jgi:hypothetical protein